MPAEGNGQNDHMFEQVLENLMKIQNNQMQHDPSVTRESVELMIRDAMSGNHEQRSLQILIQKDMEIKELKE